MDPVIKYDKRIKEGVVVLSERGCFFIALGRTRRETDKSANAWHGMGFNGERTKCDFPEFVASSINAYFGQKET